MWCEDAYGRTSLTADGKKDLTKCRKDGGSPFLDAFGLSPHALPVDNGKALTNYKYTADNFKAYLDKPEVKGPGKVRVSAITGLRGEDGNIVCNNPSIQAGKGPKESGTNYIKAAQLTNGAIENICSESWTQVLSNIGQNVSELANQIALPAGKVPFSNTLEVFVDGVKLSPADFSYVTQGNFVSFKVAPVSGADIKVRYLETVY
jgi:hypothetical protein